MPATERDDQVFEATGAVHLHPLSGKAGDAAFPYSESSRKTNNDEYYEI
jgi:hypothetical protein